MRTEKEPLTKAEFDRLYRVLKESTDKLDRAGRPPPVKKKVHEHGQHTSKKLWIE